MTARSDDARAWFAEDLRVTCNLTAPRLVEALASVPRERFLGPGPWRFWSEALMQVLQPSQAHAQLSAQVTDDADPRHVYHNVSIAIDPERNLYNGQPGLIARWLQSLAVAPGERVVHIGCGTGYFTALTAHMVGPSGRVFAIDVDAALADRARTNLRDWPWAEVVRGDGRSALPSDVDVVLVNAGATHVVDEWLDAVREGGRVLVPLTCVMPGMPAGIGKGFVVTARRVGDEWSAAVTSMVAIYSLQGIRDETLGATLGQAMMTGKMGAVTRLRRDAHDASSTCWFHGPTTCLSTS